MTKKKASAHVSYRVINGFNYPDGKGGEVRVEPETILEQLPADYAESLIEMGCVEEISDDFTTGPLTAPEEED